MPTHTHTQPTRDFEVKLDCVQEGKGIIGRLNSTKCSIVDDDIFPSKVLRNEETHPLPASEDLAPSFRKSCQYLTADEVEDYILVKGFIFERFHALYPFSVKGLLWCVYRGFYHVSMSLVIVILIDQVWKDSAPDRQMTGNYEADSKITMAALCAGYVLLATWLHSCTEGWMATNAKLGFTGKQLRDWIVSQLLWVDHGNLSTRGTAQYLNIGTSEVEAAAQIYEQVFVAVEISTHFLFNVAMAMYLFPMSALLVMSLIPITVIVQYIRRRATTSLLEDRQRSERAYVSRLSDILENSQDLKGIGASTSALQERFAAATQAFSAAHLKALLFTITTKERVELIQGQMLAVLFFVSALLVNGGWLTKGAAVGILHAFISGSKDITDLSSIFLKMKFNSEGLRSVCRILNLPTDTRILADRVAGKEEMIRSRLQLSADGMQNASEGRVSGATSGEPAGACEIILDMVTYHCPVRNSLSVARQLAGDGREGGDGRGPQGVERSHIMRINCKIQLGGLKLLLRDREASPLASHAAGFGETDEEAEDPHNDVRAIMMQLLSEAIISPEGCDGLIYKPPFLSYAYLGESPALCEGSILKAT